MLIEESPNPAWGSLGAAVGLSARRVTAVYREGDTFAQLASRLGSISPESTLNDSLYGAVDGSSAIVCSHSTSAKLGDEANTSRGIARWTNVLVELCPGLDMGADVRREGLMSRVFGGSDVQIGVPEVDRALRINAHDPEMMRRLLADESEDDRALLSSLVASSVQGLFFTDTIVGFKVPNVAEQPAVVSGMLATAARIARALGARRARCPVRPHVAALSNGWDEYGRARGMRFDATRRVLDGVVDGVPLRLGVASLNGPAQLAISLRWPKPVHGEFRLAKFEPRNGDEVLTGSHRFLFQAFTNLVSRDIRVGDGPFDDAYQVLGPSEAAVRAALGSAELRDCLTRIARVASEVCVTNEGATWFLPRAPAAAEELDQHVRMAAAVGAAMHPELARALAYR